MTTRKKTQKSTQQALNTGAQMFGKQPYTTVEDVKGTPNMVEQSMPPPTKAWTPTNWKQWDKEQQENQYQSEFERGRRYDTENKPIDTNLQTPLYQMSQQEQISRASESSKKIFSDMEVGTTVSDLIKKGEKDAAAAAREVQSKTSPYVDDNGFSAFATLRAANEARTPSKLVKDFQNGLQDKMEYLVYSHSKEIEDGAKDARMDVPTYIDKYVVPQYLSQIETSLRDEVRKGYMPKSDFEYIMSGVKDWVPGMLVRIATQTGEQYALEDEAKQQYGDKASWGVKALNEGMAFVDPTFAGAFGAGRVAGKTIQSAVTSRVNRAVQTKIGQKLAPVAVQKAADYATKFGTGAQATMAKLIDQSGSSRVGSFLTTYSKELPAEIIGQSLGMNLYGSLSGGVSTYGQTRDIYEAGKVAWEGLTSKEGVASGTAFAIGMPILHNLYGLSGLGWKAGDSLLKKTVMGGAKLAYEGASVLGTAGVMTAGHNLGYFLNGEDMDWTLNTFMEQTTTAAAMKYNPNLLKRLSQLPKMLKNMGSKATNNPLPFRLEKEEVDMILDLTHTETLSDALYTIFPDLGTASGKLRDVDARVTEAKKNYLRLMNQLPWDTANKINMLTGSMTIARPRAASYEYNGQKLMEIGEDGSILSVKEVTSREQAEAYIAEKKIAQNNADLVKSWFDAYRNNKDEMDRRVDAFEKEHNLKPGTLYSILLSDPMSRIGTNRELLLEQAAMQMEDLFRPRGKAHVDQSRIDGENVANDADVLGATPNVEAIRALDAEVDREQANFESALARAPWRKEYQSLKGKGMSDADALATLSDKYKEADLAPLADFVNAQAKQEGFLSAVGHSVDSKVSERVNTLTYRMDDKGEKAQHDDVIELVDADGNIVHLVGGVSGKTSVVNGKEYLDGDLMVIVDANGETHAVKTSDYSINRRLAKSDYDAEYREALGVKATQIIDPTEKLNPERIKQESLKKESAKEESAKEPLKTEDPAKEELAEEPVKEEKPAEEEPRDERGDLDFVNERVTPDRAVEEIYDRNGLTEEEAGDFIAEKKAEAEKLYTEASNEPVTRNTGEGLSEFAQRKAEYNAKVEGLKRNLEKWNQIETAAERRNMTKTGAELTAMDLDARERDIKRQTEERVDELAKRFGDVEKVYDISEVTNPDALAELRAGRTVYGWYDKKKDKIVLYMPNVTNPGAATRTIIHEQVIHRGLSKMFGKDYDTVLAEVYDKVMTPSEQKEFYEYVNGPKEGKEEDIRKKQLEAADEWIANNHESLRFKQYNVWSNLISSVRGILRKNGFDVDYTRRDIENLVRDSYRNLERSGAEEAPDASAGEGTMLMGSRVNKRMKEVGDIFADRVLSDAERSVVDVYSGKADKLPIRITREDGERIITVIQGNESGAGTKHSLFKHYGTTVGVITHEDILRIPEVAEKGSLSEKRRGNVRLNEYKYRDESGIEYTLVTETKKNGEVFNDFYTNKKASKQTPQIPEGDTPNGARSNVLDAQLVNKGTAISSSDQKTGSDLTNVSENETRFSKSNENQRIFVSNAEKAVEGIKQDKGTPEQWLKMIEKGGGLKAGEDKWMGLSDWLKEHKGKSITRQEVLDFIRENQIQIEEVKYVEEPDAIQSVMEERIPGWSEAFEIEGGSEGDIGIDIKDEAKAAELYNADPYNEHDQVKLKDGRLRSDDWEEVYSWAVVQSDKAKSSAFTRTPNEVRLQYTTEGLDNKREIALTVPTIESWNESDNIHFGDAGGGRAIAWVRFGETHSYPVIEDVQNVTEFHEPYKNFNQRDVYKPVGSFTSGDYVVHGKDRDGNMIYVAYINDKQLPVAHATLEEARNAMNEYYKEHPRKLKKAQRVLVIDEIQSKRHQEGREKGYKSQADRTPAKMEDLIFGEFNGLTTATYKGERLFFSKGKSKEEILEMINERISSGQLGNMNNLIPDAPFEKNWHELAMKRMLRLAAEEGYDKIAWTKGEQQAERYGLSKSIDYIDAESYGNGLYNVNIATYDDSYFIRENNISESRLTELVGKDMALSIIKATQESEDGHATIEGDNLRIGGEGMKGFYDKMLPSFMNKYGKKWGTKVGEVELPDVEEAGRTMWSVDVTPEMKESVMEGQTMFSKAMETDIDKAFNEKLSTLNDENKDKVVFDLGRPSKILLDAGVSDKPMKLYGNKVIKKQKKHGFDLSELKGLPSAIADPIAVFDNNNNDVNRSILTELHTEQGNVLAAVTLGKGMDIDVNIIRSVFGKGEENLFDWLKRGMATYINEKKTLDFLHHSDLLSEALKNQESSSDAAKLNKIGELNKLLGEKLYVRTKNFKDWFGDWEKNPKDASKTVDENGEPMTLWHETGNDFTVFNPRHEGAGTRDYLTPFGIFLKPSPSPIGVAREGEAKQMALYANIRNPIEFANRKELDDYLRSNCEGYAQAADAIKNIDAEYGKRLDDAERIEDEAMMDIYRNHPEIWNDDAKRMEAYDKYSAESTRILEEWKGAANRQSEALKEITDKFFRDSGHDGIVLKSDEGSFGRKTKTYIAFHPNQVKSAIGNVGTFSRENDDIRFSKKRFYDGMSADEVHDMMGEHAEWSSGPSNLIRELEKHYKGELVSASSGARHAMREGLIPIPGGKYSGQDGEYHHIAFRGKDGETYIESVPFVPAESAGERAGTLFRFAKTPEEFDATQKEAVEKKGIVMDGLNEAMLNVVNVPRHDFKGSLKDARAEARKWARNMYHGKVFDLPDDGGKYIISNTAIDKYLDATAITNSDNAGIHLAALKELPQIISQSIDAEVHPDYKKGENGVRSEENGVDNDGLLVHRMYGAINIDGETYRVKTTMHEFKDDNTQNTPHSYEVTKIELIESSSVTPYNNGIDRPLNVSTNSISAAKLLNGVEKSYDKGKKLLDESKTLTPVNQNAAFRKDYKAEKAQTEDRLLKGNLRETLGKGYTGFVRNLWENKNNPLYKDMHAYVNKEMQKNGFDVNKGVESFLVSKIGSNDRAFWENVRDAYAEGMKKAGNDWKPNLVDVQYDLWLSSKKGNMNDPLFKAEAVAMRDKIAKSLPPVEVVDGAYVDTDTRFRKPVLTPAAQAARDEYDRRVRSQVSRSREAFIDAMESLRVFQEVVGGKDVEDLKNVYVRENLESSIAHVEWEKYQERINKPLSQAVDKIITYMGVGGREGMKQITDYMIQKHGLERNRVMFVRDAIRDINDPKKSEQMQTDWDTDQAMLRGLLSSGSISFSEYLDMTDTYIRDNVDADYDPNKNDKSGISTYDSNRKLKGKNVEYDESYIRDLVETFEAEIGTSDMENLWDRVREATGFTLDYSYKSGMITAGARDAMKNMFSFYVPLRGYSAETMEEHYGDYLSGGSGKDLNVIKNAEGRKSEADNPLAYIANMAQGAILSGEKNVTKQHFYRLVEGNDKAPVAISEIWEVKNPQGVWEIATPDLTGARPDEIADIVHTFNEDMRNLQQNGDARIAQYQSAYRFPFEQKAHSEEHIVPVNIGGQRKLIYILADPRVAQALNGKLVNDGAANTFKLGRQALNVMSTFATSYSPEFILSNTSRDTLFANSNIASKENAAYFAKFTKNQAKAAQILTIPNLFSQYYDGTWDKSNYYRRMFAEFMDNGGRTGFIAMSKVEDMKKQLEKELTPNSTSEEVARKVGDFLKVVPGWVEAVNARSENLNRFATYLTSREMGRSEQRSASDAKEVSVNFNRKGAGSATGGVTGAVASYFRNNMMFFNAGMQATELMYRNLSKDKKTAAKTIAFQSLVPMAGSAIWATLMTLGDDDKYSQIPHWDRRNNICIPLKDTYIKIPLPVELRAFWGMGDIIAGAIDKKLQTGDNVMYELASQAASVMPLDVMGQNQEQLTKWWHVVEALSPDYVNPVFQANRNMTWNGRPIERDDDFLPAYEKAFANTPTLLVEMSKYAHAKTREGEHTAQDTDLTGWQISPGIVHHFLGSYLTGIYSLTLKTASAGTDIANGEFNVARTPFVSRVLGSYKTGEGSAVIRAKYYKYKQEYDEVTREYNNMANRTNELAMQELLNSARYKRHLVAKGYMGFISKLQELNNQATDPEAKKEISALIDNAMADIVEATDSIE